jgi:energy-coupling factor transporter ATP-binding protein EcfA2
LTSMNPDLIVSIVAVVAATAIGLWQIWIMTHPKPPAPQPDGSEWVGTSAAVALDLLPAKVRGRVDLLGELQRQLHEGGLLVLVGTGGMGKSTLARELARRMRSDGPPRWEVSGLTKEALRAGLITVARELKAGVDELRSIGTPEPSGPDSLWKLLNAGPKGWLLIVDNADDPEFLATPSVQGAEPPRVADGRGWARTTQRGLILITSRYSDGSTTRRENGETRVESVWPSRAIVRRVDRLSDHDAAQVLLDRAPEAGNENQALELARRLGGLPLVLRLAGSYLRSEYVDNATFDAFREALERDPRVIRRLNLGDEAEAERAMVMFTWELSLDALARRRMPQARPLLRLLSCFALGHPIPLSLIKADLLHPLLHSSIEPDARSEGDTLVEQLLQGLGSVGLIDAVRLDGKKALVVHPVIAYTNRVHLLEPEPSDPSPILVRGTAIDLLAAAHGNLTEDRPSDWQTFRELTPHLEALLDISTPASDEGDMNRLDENHIGALVGIASQTAMAYGEMSQPEFGITLIDRSFALALRPREEPTPAVLLARQRQAYLLIQAQHTLRAEEIYQDIWNFLQRTRPDDPANRGARYNLAGAMAAQRDAAKRRKAEAMFRELLDGARDRLGDEHPDTLAIRGALAWLLCRKGAWDEAAQELERLVNDQQRVLGPRNRSTLATRFNLAQAMLHQNGRREQAEAAKRALIKDTEQELGKDHPFTATIREFREGELFRTFYFRVPASARSRGT